MRSVNEDNHEAAANPVQNRFAHLYNQINQAAFNGTASLDRVDKNRVVLFKNGANQMVVFTYTMKSLEVEWKYKYMQKETVYKETFYDAGNISVYDQERIAKHLIEKMRERVGNHVNEIENGTSHADRSAVLGLENRNPLDMTDREKAVVFTLLLHMADADGEVDPSEVAVINSSRILFGIDDADLQKMYALFEREDYETNDALQELAHMSKKKRDLVLVTLNDIAAADSFIHRREVAFMDVVATNCGYTRDQAARLIDNHHKMMATLLS